ncbi:hypothetical protein ACFWUU_05330 [Kribbella sp. NPDC058693]|uniref:hypothetical protein n=1 Tax=Kribbella sp. NPDC058693 TaxID=3346602 RepID=UPI00365C1BC0
MSNASQSERTRRLIPIAGLTSLGGAGSLTYFHPVLGGAVLGAGMALLALLVAAALFGGKTVSRRAFRLLRLLTTK